jgi:hypothetical protein
MFTLISHILALFNFDCLIICGSISLTFQWIDPNLVGLFITLTLLHLRKKHQLFDHVKFLAPLPGR